MKGLVVKLGKFRVGMENLEWIESNCGDKPEKCGST
jgi:hypothetical protein